MPPSLDLLFRDARHRAARQERQPVECACTSEQLRIRSIAIESSRYRDDTEMRTPALFYQCAALIGAANAAHDAFLWTVDAGIDQQPSNQASAISSWTAERITARRKGIPDSQYLQETNQDVLLDISRFGGWQPPLFGEGKSRRPAKVFIHISGYEGST